MTQPYNKCPQCGQVEAWGKSQCHRCGHLFQPPLSFQERTSSDSTPERNPVFFPPTSGTSSKRWIYALAALFWIVGLIILFGDFQFDSKSSATSGSLTSMAVKPLAPSGASVTSAPASQPVSPPSSSLTNGPAVEPSQPSGMASFFNERPSQSEMPTVRIAHEASGTLTLTLRNAKGQIYQITSTEGQMATVHVPAGDYSVEVVCTDPGILPNYGDAVFRRYKEYSATFVHSSNAGPIHLGDN